MTSQDKPHIKKYPGLWEGMWQCYCGGNRAYGWTPKEAYDAWLDLQPRWHPSGVRARP